jgi:hypothetical protein
MQLAPWEKTALFWSIMVGILIFMAVAMIACPVAHGQEVIMNQPSADIVGAGHLFVRSDSFYTQHPAYFEQFINFAYGLPTGKDHPLEISVNGSDLAHGSTVWQVVPGLKFAVAKSKGYDDGHGVEFYVGDQYWQPVANKTMWHIVPGYSHGNVSYEAFAYKPNGSWRFTAGSYQSSNVYRPGFTSGAIGGIEYMTKPLYKGWMLGPGIDYASGSGSNGYASPGLSFMKGNFFLCPGYMIGNPHAMMGAHQSFVMIGYTF